MTVYEYIKFIGWILGVVTAPFVFTQSAVKKEFSRDLGSRLISINLGEWLRNLPEEFIKLFDAIFGKRHFTLLCVKRSCVASICFFIIVTITYFLFYPEASFGISAKRLIFNNSYKFIAANLLIIFTVNLVIDYISLIETRYVIGLIDKRTSIISIAIILLFDLVATASIFITLGTSLVFCYWYLIDIIFDIFGYSGTYQAHLPLNNIIDWINSVIFYAFMYHTILPDPNENGFTPIHLAYYTTFFSSIWLYFFSFIILVFKIFQKFGGRMWQYFFHNILDIEEKPFIAFSWILGVLGLFVLLCYMPFAIGS